MIEGIDLSFDAAKVTPDWAAAQIAKGTAILVVDLWTGNTAIPAARGALRRWREAGGKTGIYFVVHDSRPVSEHFQRARDVAGDEWDYAERHAIDVEVAGGPTSPDTVLAAEEMVLASGGRPILYTGWGSWLQLTGDSHKCAHLPLWDASHGIRASLEMYRQYGGWTGPLMGHQYTDTTDLDGIAVDFNVFADDFVRAAELPQATGRARGLAMCDVVWGVGNALDGVKSPYGQQLRDAIVAIKQAAGWE